MGFEQMTEKVRCLPVTASFFIEQKTVYCIQEELTFVLCSYFKVVDKARAQAHIQLHKLYISDPTKCFCLYRENTCTMYVYMLMHTHIHHIHVYCCLILNFFLV